MDDHDCPLRALLPAPAQPALSPHDVTRIAETIAEHVLAKLNPAGPTWLNRSR